MHTLFMNSRNSKTSDPQRLLLKLNPFSPGKTEKFDF